MTFKEYQQEAMAHAIGIGSPLPPGVFPSLGLPGETGEVCEKIKKIYRDKGGLISAADRNAILKESGDVLWYLTLLGQELGFTLEDVAQGNLDKLADRHARGVLRGDGDNR
jgi:NTP pyrophosphatase (non-canonical NTP hydrolase)